MRLDIYNEVIRHMTEDIKINCAEIARRMDCDPRTVKRYTSELPVKKRRYKKSILDDYKNIIMTKLDDYGASAQAIYDFIKVKGYTGSYTTVRRFVMEYKKSCHKKATVRFETQLGYQAQVDWKEDFILYNKHNEPIKFSLFLYVLGASRKKYFELVMDRKQDTLFQCMIHAFEYTEGIPAEIWFDNMRTVVDRSSSNGIQVKVNDKMQAFAKDMGFVINVCKPYRPQTKGKVESLAKLMERLKVYNHEFENEHELIDIVKTFNNAINNETSQAIKKAPNEVWAKEKEYLRPLPSQEIIEHYTLSPITRKASSESMITYGGHKYSVPTKFIGEVLVIKPYENSLHIYYNQKLIVIHPLSNKSLNYKEEHLIEILKSDALKYKEDDYIKIYARRHLEELDRLLEG